MKLPFVVPQNEGSKGKHTAGIDNGESEPSSTVRSERENTRKGGRILRRACSSSTRKMNQAFRIASEDATTSINDQRVDGTSSEGEDGD